MTKEEYWSGLIARNPKFLESIISIRTDKLKEIVYQAHDKGVSEGLDQRVMESYPFENLFKK